MAITISMINLKGGVGKTTLTVALAKYLAIYEQKNVLLIDLDKQMNATLSLINHESWQELHKNKKTILDLFKNPNTFNIDLAIQKKFKLENIASTLNNHNLHLLASDINLLKYSELDLINFSKEFKLEKNKILSSILEPIKEQYDYILIDCPPDINLIVENALECSRYYLTPTTLDKHSIFGLPYVVKAISQRDHIIRHLGIIITMFENHKLDNQYLNELERLFDPKIIFVTKIPYHNDAREFDKRRREFYTLNGELSNSIESLAKNIIQRIEDYANR